MSANLNGRPDRAPLPIVEAVYDVPPGLLLGRGTRIERDCGTCSLCCTTMAVTEIGKAYGEKCPQLSPLGRCRIYATRPTSCREFRCLWKQGVLLKELSPSRVRAVADCTTDGKVIVFHILPADRGAHLRGVLGEFIMRIVRQGVVVIVTCGAERTVYDATGETSKIIAKLDTDL